jgi:hypothetical protein
MKFDFTYFLLRVLRYYYCVFPGVSRIQLKKLKYVVDRGILWKLEVALGQQKSAQSWLVRPAGKFQQVMLVSYSRSEVK